MSARRITHGVARGKAMTIVVDDQPLVYFAGETIAAAMLAGGHDAFRSDQRGKARGLLCNMGSCYECMVTIVATKRRVRACLVEAEDGMEIATHG